MKPLTLAIIPLALIATPALAQGTATPLTADGSSEPCDT